MVKPPIVLCYLHSHIQKKLTDFNKKITRSDIKQILKRKIIVSKNQGNGGNRKGLPSEYLNDLINDLVHYKLIERIDSVSFRIVKNHEATARLRKFPF